MTHLYKVAIIILLFAGVSQCYGQQVDSTLSQIQQLPDKYYSKVDQKLNSIDDKLTKNSVKYLAKVQRQEKNYRRN